VDNLLSNAVRHSPCGGEIEVRLAVENGAAVLDILDQGPGVAAQDAPHLFDWFYTGRPPPNAVVAGTGIGLAIAQEYAQQHAGRIEHIPSARGAHFRLTLGRQLDA
jgi:two-component system sensor histidine kinase GlrK